MPAPTNPPTAHEPRQPAPPRWPSLTPQADLGSSAVGDDATVVGLEVDEVHLEAHHSEFVELGESRFAGGSMADSAWYRTHWHDLLLDSVDLANARFEEGGLHRLELRGCRLTGVDWSGAVLDDVEVSSGVGNELNMRMARLTRVRFEGLQLSGADFLGARADDVEFIGCDLTGAQFHQFRGRRVRFQNCTLNDLQGLTSLAGCTIATQDGFALTEQLCSALGISLEW